MTKIKRSLMFPPQDFDLQNAAKNGKFNPDHPYVSRVYADANRDLGPNHYTYKDWNPVFGDINRYTLKKWIGAGRYSDVFISLQDGTKECAIKLLKPVNPDRVRRELKIITELQSHPNILALWDIVLDPRNAIPCMVTEAIHNINWKKLYDSFTLKDLKWYIYRVLQGLDHVHKNGIIHRDLKPLNVLCDGIGGKLVIADWGLAEFYHPMRNYSIHVATTYYKPPEILANFKFYDYSFDIWSCGVMLLEGLTNTLHLFDGNDEEAHLCSIAKVVGGRKIVLWCQKYRIPMTQFLAERLMTYPGVNFETLIPQKRSSFRDSNAIDLANKMLCVDHKLRITAAEALKHPFFAEIRSEDSLFLV